MFKREDIRYGNFWVRLVCCSSVALAAANAVHFNVLIAWEEVARELLFGGSVVKHGNVTEAVGVLIIFCISIMLCIPRIERPLFMVGFGVMICPVYILIVIAAVAGTGYIMPVVAPLVGVFGSTTVLETMAWSEERSKRRKLERLEETKQKFVDMLVHDLRRRMSSVLTLFSLLEKKIDVKSKEVQEMVETIRASAERVVIQVNDLLDVRKIEEDKMILQYQRINMKAMLDEILQEHRAVSDLVDVNIELIESVDLTIYVDRNIFGRVIANLLWNSLQHAPRGSTVEAGWSSTSNGGVEIHVANRGKSIPVEQQVMLFKPFVSGQCSVPGGRISGTGLGLAFCKLALELHGGKICLESPWSKHGDGVQMLIKLPPSCVMHF